ncbi:hypothetical protein LTR65_010625 [Meristemomyces frigidus]
MEYWYAGAATKEGELPPAPTNVDEALQAYYDSRTAWGAAPCRWRIHATFLAHRPEHGWNITTAVAFAIGPFTLDIEQDEPTYCWYESFHRSLAQLVMFLDIVEYLQGDAEVDIDIIAQDPWFTDLEEQTLEALGVRVVEDPEAQRLVRRDTFTFAPHWGDDPEILAQCKHLRPALHIGIPVDALLGRERAYLRDDIRTWYEELRDRDGSIDTALSQGGGPRIRITMLQHYTAENQATQLSRCLIGDGCGHMCAAASSLALYTEKPGGRECATAECTVCSDGQRLDYSWFRARWACPPRVFPEPDEEEAEPAG